GEDQDRRAAERALKRLRAALEAGCDRGRQVQIRGGFLDRRYRVADRRVRGEVEAQGHRGELALVVDRERSDGPRDLSELAQRNLSPGGSCCINSAERIGSELEIGLHLEDHIVLIQGG